MIKLIPEPNGKESVAEVIILGTVEYQHTGRYPWKACHQGICQYFATKSMAVEFARTGESE